MKLAAANCLRFGWKVNKETQWFLTWRPLGCWATNLFLPRFFLNFMDHLSVRIFSQPVKHRLHDDLLKRRLSCGNVRGISLACHRSGRMRLPDSLRTSILSEYNWVILVPPSDAKQSRYWQEMPVSLHRCLLNTTVRSWEKQSTCIFPYLSLCQDMLLYSCQ